MATPFPPINLKAVFQNDGSAENTFIAMVNKITGQSEQQFKRSFGEIAQTINKSLAGFKSAGQFGLKFDIPGLKQAAADAEFARQRLIAVRDAAVSLARSSGDTSRETQSYITALRAQVIEAERAAKATTAQATTYERLQGELDKTVAGNKRLADSYRAVEIARGSGNASTGARGPDARFGVDRLLAGQASIDKAALSATTLNQVLGRVSQSYSQVAVAADGAAEAAKRGTTANNLVVNSSRSLRVATVQAGQQLQDIGISLYSGQRAAVVFAQQLPQLAFALSGLEGSANKTHDRIGRFATFLAGPWGLAVGLAAGVAVTLISSLFDMGEESDKTKKATLGLSEALTKAKFATDEGRKAIDEYNQAQQTQRNSADALIKLTLAQAEARIKDAQATRQQLAADLERQRAFASDPRNVRGEGDAFSAAFASGPIEAAIAKNAGDLSRLADLAGNLRIKDAQRDAEAAADPIKKINNYYEDMAAVATAAAKGNLFLEQSLKGVLTQIEKRKASALDAQRASKRSNGDNRQFGRQVDVGQARSIAESAGFRVTSGSRTRAEQQRLYDTVRTPQNPVALPGTSAHERGNAIDIAYGAGVSPASIKKAFAEEGVRLTKILAETGHYHIEFTTSGADKAEKDAERIAVAAAKAKEQLEQFGERSAEAIARINERFNEQPRLIDAANQSTRALDETIAELSKRKPPGFEKLIADAKEAKGVIQEALVRPFAELEQASARRIAINKLVASGRGDEADALQTIWQLENTIGPLTNERKEGVFAIAAAERAASEELAKQQEIVGAYLDATRSIRGEIEAILSGDGNLSNFKRIFKQLQGKILFEQLFGDTFRKLEKSILRDTGIEQSVDKLTKDTTRAGDAALDLANVFDEAGRRILASANGDASLSSVNSAFDKAFSGSSSPSRAGLGSIFDGVVAGIAGFGGAIGGAANDNGGLQPNGDIVVIGKKNDGTVGNMSTDGYRQLLTDSFSKSVVGKALDQVAGGLSGVVGGGLTGLATGGIPGGVIGALKGIKGLPEAADKLLGSANVLGKAADGAATGTAVAGVAKLFGFKKFSTTGSQIGGAIGSALPIPGGQIIGSIIGGTIGGLLKKAKTGSATLSIGAEGVQVGSTGGNSASRTKAASGLGSGISDSLNRIAEQLGGSADGPISVSIGIRDKSYRVDTTGKGATKKKKGAIDFGQDQEAAIKFAIADALKDGVITGIKAATQRLLTSGKDIDAQLQKALDFEGVFTRLRAYTDPVGAAIESLNKQFSRLNRIFAEAGASAQEYADLEKLYGIERAAAVKQANEAIVGSLRSLYDDLTIGNDALSLRDRKSAALAKYDPLKARVAAGDSTAFDDFATAARSLLDIERQASGSQGGYFARLDEVTSLSKAQLDRNTALADAAQASDNPLTRTTTPSNDNQGVIDAVETSNALLTAINANMGALLQQGFAARGDAIYLGKAVGYF